MTITGVIIAVLVANYIYENTINNDQEESEDNQIDSETIPENHEENTSYKYYDTADKFLGYYFQRLE
ncbi:hypothetical protein [Clostridium sp. ZBS15]|uniref:hypothetical protein n=1 Tax=Clostridium sp. ZBS15 TaxID=2949969 RepID=UPI00207A740C|nr:hypothetical protein [Clostridium sp. ZBS15]